MKHGTTTAYTSHKCRCDECRDAWRAYWRGWRERKGMSAGVRLEQLDAQREELRDLLLELFPNGLTDDCPARRGLEVR